MRCFATLLLFIFLVNVFSIDPSIQGQCVGRLFSTNSQRHISDGHRARRNTSPRHDSFPPSTSSDDPELIEHSRQVALGSDSSRRHHGGSSRSDGSSPVIRRFSLIPEASSDDIELAVHGREATLGSDSSRRYQRESSRSRESSPELPYYIQPQYESRPVIQRFPSIPEDQRMMEDALFAPPDPSMYEQSQFWHGESSLQPERSPGSESRSPELRRRTNSPKSSSDPIGSKVNRWGFNTVHLGSSSLPSKLKGKRLPHVPTYETMLRTGQIPPGSSGRSSRTRSSVFITPPESPEIHSAERPPLSGRQSPSAPPFIPQRQYSLPPSRQESSTSRSSHDRDSPDSERVFRRSDTIPSYPPEYEAQFLSNRVGEGGNTPRGNTSRRQFEGS